MTGKIIVGFDAMMRELRRLEDGPVFTDYQKFSSTTLEQYERAMNDVHIITHSLKSSGKWKAEHNHDKFEGEVSFGGASPGSVYDPVRYAKEEQGKGEEHDFMRDLPYHGYGYIESILSFFKG